jgi:N utilization substance protein B
LSAATASKSSPRRLGREIALSMLFFYEAGEKMTPESAYELFRRSFDPEGDEELVLGCEPGEFKRALPFARKIYFGVIKHLGRVDEILQTASKNWRLDRMSRVDRNVMRLAAFEMLYLADVPFKVSLNEAIEVGKAFGAEDSGAFINGVLDNVHQMLKSGEVAAEAPEKGPE